MRVINLLAFAALGAAVTPPPNPVDGTYRSYINEEGHEVHELLALASGAAPGADIVTSWVTDLNATATREAKRRSLLAERAATLSRRMCGHCRDARDYGWADGIIETWCGCGFDMNHDNCDAAVADLIEQTGHGDGVSCNFMDNYYSIRGDVVAFACNDHLGSIETASGKFQWTDWQLTTSYAAITKLCGWYIAGTNNWDGGWWAIDFNTPNIGYMRWSEGLDFCYNAVSSGASSC